jgi:hypothetical protein
MDGVAHPCREPRRRNDMANETSGSEGSSPDDVERDEEEELEEMIEHMDRPLGSDLPGTTAEEQRRGPSLERRTQSERPERPQERSVVLSEEDASDDEPELIGEESEEEASSPEERAVHERPNAPGGVWEEGDDYVEGE